MIVRYSIANFCNFKELQTLSFVPSRIKDDRHVVGRENDTRLLNTAMLYGPNSAGNGKIERNDVSYVHRNGDRCEEPTYMEITLNIDGRTYTYGFQANSSKGVIKAEWLFEEKGRRTKKLFEYIEGTDDARVGRRNIDIESPMRSSILFTVANMEDRISGASDECLSVYNWFKESLLIIGSKEPDIIMSVPETAIDDLNAVLCDFDTDIEKIIELPFRNDEIPKNLLSRIELRRDKPPTEESIVNCITFVHGNDLKRPWLFRSAFDGHKWEHKQLRFIDKSGHMFDYGYESLGAGRVLFILSLFEHLRACDGNSVFLAMDELECSIHSLNTCAIMNRYQNLAIPRTQMIISTHETQLLNEEITRKDEVWIADPRHNSDEGTEIYPMNSYPVRTRNFADSYLDGRFGGIPFISHPMLNENAVEKDNKQPNAKDTPYIDRSESHESSLLQFRVRNFLSIRDEIVLDMDYGGNPFCSDQLPDADSIYPKKITGLFGWNGCGKSSIVKAMETFRNLVTDRKFSTKEKISYWNVEFGDITEFGMTFSIGKTVFDYTLKVVPISMIHGDTGPFSFIPVYERLRIIDDNGPYTVFENSGPDTYGELNLGENKVKDGLMFDESSEDYLIAYFVEQIKLENGQLRNHIKKLYRRLDQLKGLRSAHSRASPDPRRKISDTRVKINRCRNKIDSNNILLDRYQSISKSNAPTLLTGDPRGIGLKLSKESGREILTEFEIYRSMALEWFRTSLVIIGTEDYVLPLETDEHLDGIARILRSLDTGIECLKWEKVGRLAENDLATIINSLSEKEIWRVQEAYRQSTSERKSISLVAHGDREIYRFRFSSLRIEVYRLAVGKMAEHELVFENPYQESRLMSDLAEESDGTLRILDLSSIFLPTVSNKVFVVDEIDRRLHPEITKRLIEMFGDESTEGNQLIFTSHESRLMSTRYLDTSEIVLIEKNEGAVELITMGYIRFSEHNKSLEGIYFDILRKSG